MSQDDNGIDNPIPPSDEPPSGLDAGPTGDITPGSLEPRLSKSGSSPLDLKVALESDVDVKKGDGDDSKPDRAMWDNQIEFLMSCIATSVGLGNVWRFPFVAYQNGGGAFLIPYIIVLFLIGKPMYYLECVLGQFSTRNSVKVWALSPAMKGTGYAQAMSCGYILSYYVSIIALCIFYLIMSFQSTLPWAVCDEAWGNVSCVPSLPDGSVAPPNASSSAELYFIKTVLQQSDGIEGGLGAPIWYLTLCLLGSWLLIFIIVARGVKSSGKAAYFLALFPYIVMIILLISTLFLDGAGTGILFFLTPQWEKLIELDVWYAAVTQVFFSLSVCTGAIIMFSSYNKFDQNIYRDAMIVTTLDTFTSLLSGITIFGILGNLAYELKQEVSEVIGSGGTGLAFISYPDAIAKTFQPQLFSVLFFLMMAVLGVGSGVALLSTINTVMMDAFPRVRTLYMSAFCCTVGFAIGLIYVTPGGQYILELVDYYGGTFLVLFSAISEIIGVFWIYGLENFCLDIQFMLGVNTSIYWRFCWGLITPGMMLVVFIYALTSFEAVKFGDYVYPTAGYVSGYMMLFVGIAFVPLFIAITMWKFRTGTFSQTIKKSFHAKPSWGPKAPSAKRQWQDFKRNAKIAYKELGVSRGAHIWYSLTGGYRKRANINNNVNFVNN
ncbi:sodium-dependent nutrient amino acid transporter 1-like [Aphomia sociella]